MAQKPHTLNHQKNSFNGGYLTTFSHLELAVLMSFPDRKETWHKDMGCKFFTHHLFFFFFLTFHFRCTTGACRKTTTPT